MINLRYHIVSLTAVFLAIGIGLTLGSTFLDRATVDNLNGQLESLEGRLGARDEQIDELQQEVDRTQALQEALDEQIRGGVAGLKIHEDWGATPAVVDAALSAADRTGVQVAIHSDTLNEAGFVEDLLRAVDGRTFHSFHTEGAGGGHAPDIIKIAAESNVLPASTNPTRPYTVNTLDEHLDMVMVAHHLNPQVPNDLAFAESRIRAQTIAYDDFVAHGGEHGAKEAGKMRAEGKDYVVKDGDVMNFLFNV